MHLGEYEVMRAVPGTLGFEGIVREAEKICDDLLGKGLYSEERIKEICRKEDHYFFVISKRGQIEGIFYCYAGMAADIPFAAAIDGMTADTRIGVAQSIALRNEARHRGIAASLLDHATGMLFDEENVRAIFALAWVQGVEIPAKKHLERCGYRFLEIQSHPWASCEELICPVCGCQPCICDGAVYVKEVNDDE